MENELNRGMGSQSSFGPGMEERRQELGGLPGGQDFRDMASQAGEKLMDTAERQKVAGADFVDGLAEAVRRAAGEFEGQSPQAASYIRSAADQVESFSDSLRRRDVSQMLSDVQAFAQRQPTAFLGMSFIAGFAAIRFLRSGSQPFAADPSQAWKERGPVDSGRYGMSSRNDSDMQGMRPGSGL